jgi:predicted DNA-binding protein YlxM (UPF0122 family)
MDTTVTPQVKDVFAKIPDVISQLLRLLSPKERLVIERRYNLDHSGGATLEEIGKHFKVTRERIRQIEKSALQKLRRNVFTTPLSSLFTLATDVMRERGGAIEQNIFFNELVTKIMDGVSVDKDSLILAFELDSTYVVVGNTIKLHPYIRLQNISDDLITEICQSAARLLEENGDIVPKQDFVRQLFSLFQSRQYVSPAFIESVLHLDKRLKVLPDAYGLFSWRHIHPRTLRDKIFYVLRQSSKPMHFVDIANRIIETKFDTKRVNLQAVHNELIRCSDFVLIGRGIYALKEWGYQSGTVMDVIESILKERGEMDQEDIVKSVLERRQVKRITILLALKDSTKFVRTGRKRYKTA